ncbi:MAG: thermopsin [Candidatus Thermoplasmatota archaeon]|nr:thermopsin [Candidatus Thermoplasmatota archaeon]
MNKTKVFLAILVVAIMVMGVLFVVPSTAGSSTLKSNGNNFVLVSHSIAVRENNKLSRGQNIKFNRDTAASNLIHLAKNDSLPVKDLFIPNFMSTSKVSNGLISPGYSQSPAPMGIGFYGLYNKSGHIAGRNYTFPSVAANVNLSNLQTINLADDVPQTVTFQLNSVLSNVNLFGNSNYSFWTQNVVDYSARTHQVSLILNIWNFSNPNGTELPILNNVLYSSSGQRYNYPDAIIIFGPTFQLDSAKLELNLYMNTSIVNGRQALWFNYSLPQISQSGTYEEAVFNSTTNAAPLTYLVSGTTLTPTGFVPYDSEIMIGGPGGGSTATVQNISGTMNLMYYNTTQSKFVNVPNAYDIGSETGETSTGVDVHYTGSTAYLTSGPSMVYGLWNETNNTFATYSGKVSGNSAFLFIGKTSKDAGNGFWNWAPLNGSGKFTYYLPKSMKYPFEALQNYYNISGNNLTYLNVTTPTIINMKSNVSMGIYTPIILNGNKAVMTVASSGKGTRTSPYKINAYSANGINSIFGQFNDYLFPVFPGVFIYNTNVNVTVANFQMATVYSGYASNITNYGFLGFNGLPMWIYNSTNVSITGGTFGQWYSLEQDGYYEGSLELWNSTNVNVTGSTFLVYGNGALVYNAPYQYGNISFYEDAFIGASIYVSTNLTNPFWSLYLEGTEQVGLQMSGTGYSVKMSQFYTETPIISPECNVMTGNTSVSYSNVFSNNAYWNYNGTSPYNNYGLMQTGSDLTPMIPKDSSKFTVSALKGEYDSYFIDVGYLEITLGQASGVYSFTSASFYLDTMTPYKEYVTSSDNFVMEVTGNMILNSTTPFTLSPVTSSLTVDESGLPSSTVWTVSYYYYQNVSFRASSANNPLVTTQINSTAIASKSSSNTSITINGIAPGYYYVAVNSSKSFEVSGDAGFVLIEGQTTNMVQFTHVNMYSLTFNEAGLASGTTWSVVVNGVSMSSSSGSITFTNLYGGSYSYYISVPSGYSTSSSSGTVTVMSNTFQTITFTKQMYTIEFQETGLTSGTNWTVTVNGKLYNSTTQDINVSVPYGAVSYTVGNVSGYLSTDSSGSFVADGNAMVSVLFGVQSSYSDLTYVTIAIAAIAGIVVGAVVIELFRKK